MSINKENKFTGSLIREFHLWNLPDSAFILLNKEANDEFFKGMYALFGNQLKFAKFLGLSRQGVHKYHKQALKNDGKFYPVYFPLRLLNKCLPLLDKKFMYYLEQNISEIRARVGLSVYNTKLPIIESEEIYRILAHIIADGSASKGKTPYYANICKELREQFKKDLQIFGEMKIYERKPQAVELVFFPKIVTDVLAYLFDIQFTYPNRIPKLLFSAKEEYKKDITAVFQNMNKFLKPKAKIFVVVNDRDNLYPDIAKICDYTIQAVYQRPVLMRTERDNTKFSESVYYFIKNN